MSDEDVQEMPPFRPSGAYHQGAVGSMTNYETAKRDPLVRALEAEYSAAQGLRKGARVAVTINAKTEVHGVIRFADELPEKEPGLWLGVELDSSRFGKNYGNIGGRTVFVLEKNRLKDGSLKPPSARKKYGMFVRPDKVRLEPTSLLKPGTKVWVTNLLAHPVIRYDFDEDDDPAAATDSDDDDVAREAKARVAAARREAKELRVVRDNITKPKMVDPAHPELNVWEEEGRIEEDAGLTFRTAPKTVSGTVRFVGKTQFAYGTWVGVELDDPHFGKNFGYVDGVRYFTCSRNMRTPDAVLEASMKRFIEEQEASRNSRESDRLHTGAFTHLRWGYDVYKRLQAGETTEEEEVRKEIARRRHARRVKDKRLTDLKLIDIKDRVAYGVFVRPSRVVVNDTLKKRRARRKRAQARAEAELERRLEEEDAKVINGPGGDAVIRDLLSQADGPRLPKGPDAAVVPVFPPHEDEDIVVNVVPKIICDPDSAAAANSLNDSALSSDVFDDDALSPPSSTAAPNDAVSEASHADALDAVVDAVAAAAGVDDDDEYEYYDEEEVVPGDAAGVGAPPPANNDDDDEYEYEEVVVEEPAPPPTPANIPGVIDDGDLDDDDDDSSFGSEAF